MPRRATSATIGRDSIFSFAQGSLLGDGYWCANLALNGGFNDWGFSIGVSNFDYAGSMGLWRSLPPTAVGFSSFLGSRYDPVADVWTTFSSGGEVSFAARLVALPSPGGVGLAGVAALGVLRRRRVA